MPNLQLGQLRPTDTKAAVIYIPAADKVAKVKTIVICNVTSTNAKYSIFQGQAPISGGSPTFDEDNALFWDVRLPAKSTVSLEFADGITLRTPLAYMAVQSSVANAITFTVYGEEN